MGDIGEEVLPEGKNFRLATADELPALLDFLEKHLPHSLKFHQTLRTYMNDRVWDFHFYVSKTWPDQPVCLHFPGMTNSPNGRLYESFSVFCPADRLEELSLLEEEDMLLDWSQPLYLNFTHSDIVDRLESFYSDIGTVEKVHGDLYVYEPPAAADATPNEPIEELNAEEAEVRQLSPEHADAIHDLYPANDLESIEVFRRLLSALPAYGVFSATGELAAWMVQSYYGAMFSMQTRPEFRRKGYGLILARRLSAAVANRGYQPFVVIRPENDASLGLYAKLGFRRSYSTVRVIFRPHAAARDNS
ncbi:uncharacterized protein LOC126334915 [Schistocerca gregaria]|uniref:uncharacterized protein LOC126334915 n=1 Tax=Schistocerca gregaria TaxID=7010 RepID=UPI00211E26BE|nr:uncharacterized protein LOC126334915 [Schistocerca gregaria]